MIGVSWHAPVKTIRMRTTAGDRKRKNAAMTIADARFPADSLLQ
jgi:hypothetical protein